MEAGIGPLHQVTSGQPEPSRPLMRTLIVLSMLCSSTVAAPVPKEPNKAPSLEGVWKLASLHVDGADCTKSNALYWRIDSKGNLSPIVGKDPNEPAQADTFAKLTIDAKESFADINYLRS